MADTSVPVCEITETVTVEETPARAASNEPTLTLRLKKPRTSREVRFTEDTVDNEGMNKKSSKCCCIYTKPKTFDESSSSESDEDCEHCRGHVEKKKKRLKPSDDDEHAGDPNTGHPVPTKS